MAGETVKYNVLCFLCKNVIRDTRDIHESYARGICMRCSFVELVVAATKAKQMIEQNFLQSTTARQTLETLKTALTQAEKVKL